MVKNWVNNKYIKERIIFQIEVDVSYRIKKHRKKLISELKKNLKGSYFNGNVTIKKVKQMEAANATN